jgi:phospholipid/cholesterol/gamma-HCH transport system substrate-binding protein
MTQEWEMTYKKMSYLAGLIVFLAAIIFLFGILWLSGNQIFFSNAYTLDILFDDAVGLQDQAPVFMRGYRIGSTKEVELEEEKIRVTINVDKRFRIPADSKVEINMLNFLGEKGIMVLPGSAEEYLQPNSVISGVNKDLMSIAKDILFTAKEKVEEGDLNRVIATVSESVESLNQLLRKASTKVENLDMALYNTQIKELGQAGKGLKEFLEVAQGETQNFSAESRVSLDKFNDTLDQVNNTLEQLAVLSSELSEIARDINTGRGTAGELLQNKATIENLNETIKQLTAFLEDIRENPKKYVKFSIF